MSFFKYMLVSVFFFTFQSDVFAMNAGDKADQKAGAENQNASNQSAPAASGAAPKKFVFKFNPNTKAFVPEREQKLNQELLDEARVLGPSLERVQKAIRKGAHVNCCDKQGNTPLTLIFRVTGNRLQPEECHKVASLLLASKANANAQNNLGDSALHGAMSENEVELLLRHKADVSKVNKVGSTPLHNAVTHNSKMVEMLLAHKANPTAKDTNSQTPLLRAITHCHGAGALDRIASYKLLIDHYKPEDLHACVRDESGKGTISCLSAATWNQCPFLIFDMCERGAIPELSVDADQSLFDHVDVMTRNTVNRIETIATLYNIYSARMNQLKALQTQVPGSLPRPVWFLICDYASGVFSDGAFSETYKLAQFSIRKNLKAFPSGVKEHRDRNSRSYQFEYPDANDKTVFKTNI